MELQPSNEEIAAFVERHSDAAMVTLRKDGTSHMARVELGVVDGRIRSAGSPDLVRSRNLRRDPRCSLFVFGPHPWWLGLETKVAILDDADAPDELIRLLRIRHVDATPPGMVMAHDDSILSDRLYTEAEFLEHTREERLFVFDFTIQRAYGNFR